MISTIFFLGNWTEDSSDRASSAEARVTGCTSPAMKSGSCFWSLNLRPGRQMGSTPSCVLWAARRSQTVYPRSHILQSVFFSTPWLSTLLHSKKSSVHFSRFGVAETWNSTYLSRFKHTLVSDIFSNFRWCFVFSRYPRPKTRPRQFWSWPVDPWSWFSTLSRIVPCFVSCRRYRLISSSRGRVARKGASFGVCGGAWRQHLFRQIWTCVGVSRNANFFNGYGTTCPKNHGV